MKITLIYTAVDGYRDRRTFKTLRGAQKYAQDRVGTAPDGYSYLVSPDGVGTLDYEGCSRLDLFPALAEPEPTRSNAPLWYDDASYAAYQAADIYGDEPEPANDHRAAALPDALSYPLDADSDDDDPFAECPF
jgi:hypothetical protein